MKQLLYPEPSYVITGCCFRVHNSTGRFAREKQYGDLLEIEFQNVGLKYIREFTVPNSGNRLDFIIEDSIVIELKAKPFIEKMDYYQLQRYLQNTDFKLGLLINFRSQYLKPQRVVRIDNINNQ